MHIRGFDAELGGNRFGKDRGGACALLLGSGFDGEPALIVGESNDCARVICVVPEPERYPYPSQLSFDTFVSRHPQWM